MLFLNRTHLPQALSPDDYYSQEQHAREQETLFLPNWHFVASLDQFPRDGSFLAYDLLGYPLITWRQGDELQTYLNVCPHRYSMLRKAGTGCSKKLKCQYHGWEFNQCGDTQRIPDAPSFKPLRKGELGLTRIHTKTLGPLIYVSLADDPNSLEKHYGAESLKLHQEIFNSKSKLIYRERRLNAANWKVVVENSLESYHLDEVHPWTFSKNPEEAACTHKLETHRAHFSVASDDRRTQIPILKVGNLIRRLLSEDELEHRQVNIYPHISFARVGFYAWVECTIPVSPTESYDEFRIYCNLKNPGSLASRFMLPGMALFGKLFFWKLFREDRLIFSSIQKGLESPQLPNGGLISRREERVSHFQEYIQRTTQDAWQPESISKSA